VSAAIPLTRLQHDGLPRVGQRFVARTVWGRLGFDDTMVGRRAAATGGRSAPRPAWVGRDRQDGARRRRHGSADGHPRHRRQRSHIDAASGHRLAPALDGSARRGDRPPCTASGCADCCD